MRIQIPKSKRVWITGVLLLTGLATFQNCSQVGFQQLNPQDFTHTFSNGGSGKAALLIEGGRSATNKHLLNLTIVGLNPNTMDQMRVANKKDMVGSNFPASAQWQPFQTQFQWDLNDDFASDGTKDTQKAIVVEVKPKSIADVQKVDPFSSQILLDTVPPSLSLLGVLKFGLNGTTYTKGQAMPIDWTAAEVVAPTGQSSGLDPNASIQMTWSDPDDCSRVDASALPLLADNSATRKFVWPKDSRLENFYICIFAVDRAGNRTTGLSQPMNDIWQVIAGDNNQGNGGSWKAANVRFSYPIAMAVDSKDNLYIYDNDFSNIRKVSTDGVISAYLGNGTFSNAPMTEQFGSLPTGTMGLTFDSSDRLYYGSNPVYRFTVNETTHKVKSEPLVNNVVNFAVHKFSDGIEYIVFSTIRAVNDSLSGVYIYKVPLSKFDGNSVAFDDAALASYRIAGNGTMNDYNQGWLPRQQAAMTAVLPEVRSLQVDSNDDIYFNGITDGSGYDLGEHALFLLRAGQVYKLTSQNVGPYWAQQLELITRADGSKYALSAGHYGLVATKLNLTTLPVTADLPTQVLSPTTNPSAGIFDMSYGVAQLHQRINNEPVYYSPDQTNSKINKYIGLSRVDSFGRNVYNATDTDALTSMVNVPMGFAEDPSGNIYFFEALSDIVRKLDTTGHISVFAGSAFNSSDPNSQVGKTPAQALLAGESYGSGYTFPMVYDDANARLILGMGATGVILNLPITAGQTITKWTPPQMLSTTMSAADYNGLDGTPDKNQWPIYDLHLQGSNLIATRTLTVVPYREQVMVYNGNTASVLLGNEITPSSIRPTNASANVYTGAATSVALAWNQPIALLNNTLYATNASGVLMSNGGNVTKIANIVSPFKNFDMTSDSAGRKFMIGTSGNDMKAVVINADGSAKDYVLCMPGSFVNAQYVKISRDGKSLVISDTGQRRLLRYWLKSNDQIHLFQKPTSGTTCVPINL